MKNGETPNVPALNSGIFKLNTIHEFKQLMNIVVLSRKLCKEVESILSRYMKKKINPSK